MAKPSFLDALQGKRDVGPAMGAGMETPMPPEPKDDYAGGCVCPQCGAKLKVVADEASETPAPPAPPMDMGAKYGG